MDAAEPACAPVETRPGEPSTLTFTSGTTGAPKGCVIPHGALVGLVPFVQHVLALVFPRLVFEGDFGAAAWWEIAERHAVTHLAGAPTVHRTLAAAGTRPLAGRRLAVRRATSAGEPLNSEPIHWLGEHAGIEVHDAYGLTEVGMAIGNPRSVAWRPRAGSLGFPVPGHEVALLDDHGRPVGPGETEIIAVRRHPWFLSTGYWSMDDAWRTRWRDDVIVTAGINVGPFEVESALVSHPAVAEAAVVGRPAEVRAVAALPRTETGKIQRAALRREAGR